MKIQNSNNNFNFKATKVLTVQKNIQCKAPEMIDVFRLNKKEDLNFVRRCLFAINSRSEKLDVFVKKLKAFLISFLNDTKIDSQDYLLAIKNGEEIIGGCEYLPTVDDISIYSSFSKMKKPLIKDSLYYQLLSDAGKNYEMALSGVKLPEMFNTSKMTVPLNEIKSETKFIKKRNPEVEFKLGNEKVDLNKFLGIDEFDLSKMAE